MSQNRATGKLRIIGGEWRSRRLSVVDLPGLRPTTDRNRETLFNWLTPYIRGRHCLDLFAGSGSLGLEALSRGAASCVFVDRQRKATQQLCAHLEALGATARGEVHCDDALNFLDRTRSGPRWNLIFLDPPFHSDLLGQALPRVVRQAPADALLYLEHSPKEPPVALAGWECLRSKRAGDVLYALYERN